MCAGSREDGYHASTEGALALVTLAMTRAGEEVQATTIGAKGDARAVCMRACVRGVHSEQKVVVHLHNVAESRV